MRAVILEGDAVNPGDISWEPVSSLVETKIYANTYEDEKWERLEDCELVLTNKIVIDEAVFERFPKIRYVGVCATGYNVVDLQAAAKRGIIVTNIPAYSTDSVVQHTWALILEIASKVSVHNESVHRGEWIGRDLFCYWKEPLVELAGKTLGIYGFGNIGRGVASVALAFGMHVLVHTAHPSEYLSYIGPNLRFCDEKTVFDSSDILTFHCPLTEETRGIVNEKSIGWMKDGAILINVSRGPIVQEQALTDALKSGKLRAAGLDVIDTEPMLPDNPLLDAPNLVITPHIAWASREARMRLVEIAAQNLKSFLAGEPVNVVV